MSEWINVIYVAGSNEDLYTCITSAARPGAWHAWWRAGSHAFNDYRNGNYFERCEAWHDCVRIASEMIGTMPPRRWT